MSVVHLRPAYGSQYATSMEARQGFEEGRWFKQILEDGTIKDFVCMDDLSNGDIIEIEYRKDIGDWSHVHKGAVDYTYTVKFPLVKELTHEYGTD